MLYHLYQSRLDISSETPAVRKRRGRPPKHNVDLSDFTGIETPELDIETETVEITPLSFEEEEGVEGPKLAEVFSVNMGNENEGKQEVGLF